MVCSIAAGQLGFALQGQRRRDVARGPSAGIRVGPPRLRQEQPFVHEGIAMARGIAREHPDLTILDLCEGATVLPCYPSRVRPLFDKARFIEHQHAFRIAHRLGDELMVVPQHLLLIPECVTDKSLHPPDGASCHLEGHGLDGLAFQLTELAYHIVEEMDAWLTACNTV